MPPGNIALWGRFDRASCREDTILSVCALQGRFDRASCREDAILLVYFKGKQAAGRSWLLEPGMIAAVYLHKHAGL